MRSKQRYQAVDGSTAGQPGQATLFDRAAFGRALLAAMVARNSSYRKVEAEIGISPSKLCRIARGMAQVDVESYLRISHWIASQPAPDRSRSPCAGTG